MRMIMTDLLNKPIKKTCDVLDFEIGNYLYAQLKYNKKSLLSIC